MKLGEIDYNLKPDDARIFLCRPDKKTIARISEAYDINYSTKLSVLNEISFKIPTVLIEDGVPVDNKNIDKIKNRYLFKLKYGNVTEYFLINESNKSYSEDEHIEFTSLSLGVQLSDKNIRQFEVVSKTLSQVTTEILSSVNTKWKLGYVDTYFEEIYRSYEVASNNVLEIIYDLANVWNALIVWDSVKYEINFYKPENIGKDKGFYLRDGKYLESFNLATNTIDTITRLKVYGQDGLSIHRLNPTGQSYLEDYRYYLYPFKRENGVVVSHSKYLSDSLCIALEDFKELVESLSERFTNLTEIITTQKSIIQTEEQRLSSLNTQRIIIEDELDLSNANFQSSSPNHLDIIQRLEAKRDEISNQKAFIRELKYQLSNYEDELDDLRTKLARENNFTVEQLEELSDFEIEKEYTNDSIVYDEDLIEDGKEVFRQYLEPKIKLDVNLIDFLSIVECQNDWDKLSLGDIVRVRYDRLQVDVKAKITEITRDFENGSISVVIENEFDEGNNWLEQLNKAGNTSTIVQMDKWKWNLSEENNGAINNIVNNKWDALKNAVMAGYNQKIEISERGIIVRNLEDPLSWLVIQNGFLAITNDDGQSWKHAISKDGIFGERIFGKIISGVNLIIEDESGIWMTQGSRTTIYNRYGDEVMRLGLVSDNEKDNDGNLIPQENECFGLVSCNNITKVTLTTCEGFSVSKRDGDDWKKVLWANTDGTLYSRNMVAENIKIVNNLDEVILDAENDYFNIGLFDKIVADGKLTTLEKLEIIKELYKIHSDYKLLLQQAQKYIISERDNITDVDSEFDTKTQTFDTVYSTTDKYSTSALKNSYLELMDYISNYIKVISNGYLESDSLNIDMTDPLTESTSAIENRGIFVQKFKDYYDEATRLRQAIEDSLFYSGLQMGSYHNNLIMNDFGFIAVRSDGKYRAYLNATNGLALQKWENGKWTSKLFATLGDSKWEDGTLYAEGLVTKNLRIVDGDLGDAITLDWKDGITIYGDPDGDGVKESVIRLNASSGISIHVKDDKKFYIGIDGRLYAKDITTHNLKIVDGKLGEKIVFDHEKGITINGNNGEQIRLNANEGIAIDVKKEPRFWINKDGHLYARKLFIMNGELDESVLESLDKDDSFISDLTVTRLRTYDKDDPYNYVHIKQKYLRFITRFDLNNPSSETAKYEMYFEGSGVEAYPVAIWGTGSGANTDYNKAKQYKTPNGFFTEYVDEYGEKHSMNLTTDREKSIELTSPRTVSIKGGGGSITMNNSKLELTFGTNTISMTANGIKINGNRIDLN
ncbi:phage tail spike protein [Lysinibacillus sp. M3]|uniref:Phage tail spike protein n=1 Tax=Lysinibacillus zambalensis TaxID=3160866 RepID=A0ABV1MRX0_9BACI